MLFNTTMPTRKFRQQQQKKKEETNKQRRGKTGNDGGNVETKYLFEYTPWVGVKDRERVRKRVRKMKQHTHRNI